MRACKRNLSGNNRPASRNEFRNSFISKDFRQMNTYHFPTITLATMTSQGHQFCVRVEKNWETRLE
jgi:hypothetical protein